MPALTTTARVAALFGFLTALLYIIALGIHNKWYTVELPNGQVSVRVDNQIQYRPGKLNANYGLLRYTETVEAKDFDPATKPVNTEFWYKDCSEVAAVASDSPCFYIFKENLTTKTLYLAGGVTMATTIIAIILLVLAFIFALVTSNSRAPKSPASASLALAILSFVLVIIGAIAFFYYFIREYNSALIVGDNTSWNRGGKNGGGVSAWLFVAGILFNLITVVVAAVTYSNAKEMGSSYTQRLP
eukprot:tig00000093_g3488.t1